MYRIAMGIEYDGTHYHGWQIQKNGQSIQAKVELALSSVANQEITCFCAGRTDAGVHAREQVIHFNTNVDRSQYAWVFGANSKLPKSISVIWAKTMDDTFHARYSATARTYHYIIYNRKIRPSLNRYYVGWVPQELDVEKMQQATQFLIGEHNFSSFRAVACQTKHPYRNIQAINVVKDNDYITIKVTANAFLQHMVRNIVGSLILVGKLKKPVNWIQDVLNARSREQAGPTAVACGLTLEKISYPDHYDI